MLRHLRRALLAPAADLAAAQEGSISTNQLVHRAHAELQRQAQQKHEADEQRRTQETAKAARVICNWLSEIGLHRPSCEMIVDEVRRELATRQANGTLRAPEPNVNLPVDEIIRRCKPATDESIDIIASHAQWLYNWSFFAFPDPHVRENALDLALQQQWKR